jgi:hypothetical protein
MKSCKEQPGDVNQRAGSRQSKENAGVEYQIKALLTVMTGKVTRHACGTTIFGISRATLHIEEHVQNVGTT